MNGISVFIRGDQRGSLLSAMGRPGRNAFGRDNQGFV